jgi:hypothetical protein
MEGLPEQEVDGGQTVYYVFFRWYDYGLGVEREEASSKDSEAKEAWARALERCTPPARAWEQKRWNIETICE